MLCITTFHKLLIAHQKNFIGKGIEKGNNFKLKKKSGAEEGTI